MTMTCITISLRTDLLSHPKSYHGIYTQLEVTGAPVHDRKNQYTITVQLLPPPHCHRHLSEVCLTKNGHRALPLYRYPKTCTVLLPERNPPFSLLITFWPCFFVRDESNYSALPPPHNTNWNVYMET